MRENNSRSDILSCALKLFSERGYDSVGVSEIVDAAEVKKPTLYYFFGSKEGLLEALLAENFDRLDTALREVCVYEPHPKEYARDVFPVLCAVTRCFFEYARENRSFYLLALSLSFAPPESSSARLAEKYLLRQYAALEGLFVSISSVHCNLAGRERAFAARFLALINAQIAIWNRGHASMEEEDAESIVRGFLHGVFS